ncbi:metallophosphoesterase [Naumannella cuiyingiana]|uniref:Putative MPP superfamily phosphohydrolase n=1 Tax=Naumannella cuiyingiana TaxID=1347891 RepID=A0A7Z0IL75_9ACTN|nr:putative MPP superfamily phosphohydrolase [Naumannella cuiyingiana]
MAELPRARSNVLTTAGLVLGAGGACLAYGAFIESRAFRLREATARCLPPGSPSLRLLHVSDLHLAAGQRHKIDWVAGLAELDPDLVINTGDNLSGPFPERVLEAYAGLLGRPGAFVFGSNDYLAPVAKNPLRYLGGSSATHPQKPVSPERHLPWRPMRDAFRDAGWVDLTNARGELEVKGVRLALRGVDDPHIELDDYAAVAGPADPAALSIGLAHAPYRRILDEMARDHVDLILSGHTHGGQVCVPGFGAVITNCDIDRARVKGLSTHSADGWTSLLHVSAGLGMSPFAPYRFACPPEATLLTLLPR